MNSAANVLFRVDASHQLGNGHVMRCLALARVLSERGLYCRFVFASLAGHPGEIIRRQGFEANELPLLPRMGTENGQSTSDEDSQEDASHTVAAIDGIRPVWLIVDHYGLDHRWERLLQPHCERIMVVDDLANRGHDCDLLLDQNLGRSPMDYRSLVPPAVRLLLGPRFAMLRPEFAMLREQSLARRKRPKLRNIMISMGGTDPTNATSRLLVAMRDWPGSRGRQVVVSLGPQAPWANEVTALAAQMPFECQVYHDPPNYARLMANSDLCIGTAGVTSWERCCLGVPSLVASVAHNQVLLAEQLVASGAALARLDLNRLDTDFTRMMDSALRPDVLGLASRNASALCSGIGAELVASELLGETK